MVTYRAKLIVERVELRRPMIRGTEVPKEGVYDEVRIEVTAPDSDIALSKVIGLALSEQKDRQVRKMTQPDTEIKTNCPGVPHRGHTKSDAPCPVNWRDL